MKKVSVSIQTSLGILTQIDSSQIPFGGALSTAGFAALEQGRIRRIPGITVLGTAPVDMAVQVPLLFFAKSVGGSDYSIAVALQSAARKVVNLTTGAALTGPALSGSIGQPWSYTFYAQKHIFSGGGNAPHQIDDASNYSAVSGASVPTGNLVQAFLDRLYVADIGSEEGIVRFSDVLTTNFAAANIVNTKEIPGKTTALGILTATSDAQGINTDLLVMKRNAIWVWNETRKDIVSTIIGTQSPQTLKNTRAGTIFLGLDGNRNSVFLLATGGASEPVDIGRALHDYLNGSTKLASPTIACAIAEDHFYKLWFAVGTDTINTREVWLDLDRLIDGQPVWYGPHQRGNVDSVVRTENRLEIVRRTGNGNNVWFRESADTTQNFTDMDGNVIPAMLDLPLSIEPYEEEKMFDIIELQLARESNLPLNSLTIETIADGVSQGTLSKDLYNAAIVGVLRLQVPLYPAGQTGVIAHDLRLRLTHALNKRFDVLGATLQYERHASAESRIRSDIKKS